MNGVIKERKLATCTAMNGIYPIGGSVNGIDQMNEHLDSVNFVPSRTAVEIAQRSSAEVSTYGGFHAGERIEVVALKGRRGFYPADAFAEV